MQVTTQSSVVITV